MQLVDRPGAGPFRSGRTDGFIPFPSAAVDGTIGDRFAAVAAAHPESTALSSPAGRWTYGELAGEVTTAAAAIHVAVDAAEPTPVGVLAAHDGPLVAAILAVIVAGHVVVIIDPSAPTEQIDHVVAESGLRLVVADAAMADVAAGFADRHHDVVVAAWDDLVRSTVAATLPRRRSDDAAMLAFTSGTSGAPKAAVITHGVLLNVVRGATDALGITAADRLPMLFPTSLAVAAYPMFIPLLNGGTLATLDVRSVGLAPIGDFLARERITVAYMAPTVIRFLVGAVEGPFPDLRLVALGGELVDTEVVRLTQEMFAPDLIANGFGTTETGVISLHVLDPAAPLTGAVPSGFAVEDVEILILDDRGRPVEPGVAGEIAVTTPRLFLGYWGHDDLTAGVLEPDPGGRVGWSLYRTGDLGRHDLHGALVVLGRLDTKVKVRGRFVVLGDVEAALHELDAVVDAAVVGIERRGNVELAALVVVDPALGGSTAELRAELLLHHEAYRVPSVWTVVDELPRLPNGKVDRQALTPLAADVAADATGSDADTAAAPGRDDLRRALRDLWELLLPVEAVGLDDDFMALGGDSLLAAQMLVMAEQRLGVAVPMGRLLDAGTIRGLADVMAELAAATEPSTAQCVQAGDADRPILWFIPDLQGSAYRVRHLARHLGADQPVWSFESPLLAGEPNRFGSLETFVARLLTDVYATQPEGPYWIAGYSFGGICAYEMARQLRRDGHEVAFLGVVDVGPGYRGPAWDDRRSPSRPWFGVAKPPPAGSSPVAQVRHYADMFRQSRSGFARHVMVRSGSARFVDPLRFAADLRRHGRVRPEWRLWYAWEEHWKLAAKSWDRRREYHGRLDLFWAGDTGSTDGSMGWADLVADLRVHRFPGFHDDLLEEKDSPALGATMRGVIDELVGSD